jgi:two-component system cell cycle sensor histidine kinase/response regulator CckA
MSRARSQWRPLTITALYVLLSAAWIIASDRYLDSLQLSPKVQTILGTLKGMAYLAVTAGFIYTILRKLHVTQKNLERDVRARTAALLISEADLRKSEERMRRLLSGLPDVTRTSNPNGAVTYISANVKRLVGFSAEEVCAFPPEFWISRIHDEDRTRVVEAYRKLFADGDNVDVEFRIRHRDGHWVWLHDRASRTKNGGYHADGIFSDITTRKLAEEQARQYEAELRSNEEKLRHSLTELGMTLEAARAGVYDIDLSTGMITWSDELRLVYGMQPGEFKGTMEDWVACLLPEDAETTLAAMQANIEKGGGVSEFRIRRRDDGEIHWLEARGQVIHQDGRPIRMIGINTDITERKRAEIEMKALSEQFRHAQKMEAVGRLAGGMAHDFNNLLMVIRGYTEIIAERLPGEDPLHKHSEEVIKAADRASSLTRQLLAFSRKQVLSPVVFNAGDLVHDTTKMLKRLIGEDVELKVKATEPLWAVKADRDQMVQVLMNLCVNARDAMPKGGALTIGLENATISPEEKEERPYLAIDDYLKLTIEDTGTGMSAEVKEHIFEPFFTTKEIGKGTGLGLSTVYGIVKQSGGYIWVDSNPGQGTRFTICLPRALETTAERFVPDLRRTTRGTETILVVEDEDGLRGAICDYLQGLGYRVLTAESGYEAIRISANVDGGIGLLLTDVVMPRMSGRELSEKLHATRPSMKTIFMSGYIDDSVLRHGVEESQLFLQKPFKLAELAALIREVLGTNLSAQSA